MNVKILILLQELFFQGNASILRIRMLVNISPRHFDLLGSYVFPCDSTQLGSNCTSMLAVWAKIVVLVIAERDIFHSKDFYEVMYHKSVEKHLH